MTSSRLGPSKRLTRDPIVFTQWKPIIEISELSGAHLIELATGRTLRAEPYSDPFMP